MCTSSQEAECSDLDNRQGQETEPQGHNTSVPEVTFGAATVPILVIKSVIILFCVLVNVAALSAILYGRMYRKCLGIHILSIVINGLLLGLLALPLAFMAGIIKHDVTGTPWCDLTMVSYGVLLKNSIYCLCLLCLDRYIAIIKPYWYIAHVTCRKSVCACVVTWLFSITTQVVILVMAKDIHYDPHFETCLALELHPSDFTKIFRNVVDYVILLVSYVIIIGVTSHIYVIVRRHKRKIAELNRISGQMNAEDEKNVASFQSVTLMVVVAVLTALPSLVLMAISLAGLRYKFTFPLQSVLVWIMSTNSIFNVIVYWLKTKTFREHFLNMMKSVLKPLYSEGYNVTV